MVNSTNYIFRRKGYGYKSCNGIAEKMQEFYPELDIEVARKDQVTPDTNGYVFRWGCTANVSGDPTVVNSAKSIHRVYNKKEFRLLCAEKGLSPKSWGSDFEYLSFEFMDGIDTYKDVIVRKNFHKQGKNLHRCTTADEVVDACNQYDDYYISEYIPKVKEYRVLCVSGRVIYMYDKIPENPDDVAWNHAQGGSMDNVKWGHWPLEVVKVACEAFSLSKLDFGAVDIMVDEKGKAYVLEINTAPETTSPHRQGCFAKAFKWIIDNGKDSIPVIEEAGWKGYIHPAVSELAKV